MGEIIFEGESPFRLIPAQASTARVSGQGVEMTVYVSVEGKHSSDFQIQVPMTPDDARLLSALLTASAIAADLRRTRR
jgi:hypothetical protein